MADPKIRIVVEAATAAAERSLRGLQRTVNDTGTAGGKAAQLFEGFQTAIGAIGVTAAGVTGGVIALKKVMEFGAQGASIAQTRDSFDGLMRSLGQGSDVLENMRAASRGTIDDMTLMSSTLTLVAGAGDALASAMVGASPQLLEIAKAANKLNPSLGTTAQMYESIATGIKRSSPLILDNLGLTIKVGEANEAYAAQLGKSVEELTAQERQMALLNATLAAGDILINQVGGDVGAMGDEFAAAQVKMQNATDNIKADVYPAIADLFSVIAEGGPQVADTANQIVSLTEAALAFVSAAITGKDATLAFEGAMYAASGAVNQHIEAAEQLDYTHENLMLGIGATTVAAQSFSEELGSVEVKTEDWAGSLEELSVDLNQSEEDANALTGAINIMPSRKHIYVKDNFDEAAGKASGVAGAVNSIPSSKTVHIKVITSYVDAGHPGSGPTGPVVTPGYQHGGQFMVRGPTGRDRVPGAFRATAGEIVTVTPVGGNPPPSPVNNYNLSIHTNAPAESALSDFYVMRALAGV